MNGMHAIPTKQAGRTWSKKQWRPTEYDKAAVKMLTVLEFMAGMYPVPVLQAASGHVNPGHMHDCLWTCCSDGLPPPHCPNTLNCCFHW